MENHDIDEAVAAIEAGMSVEAIATEIGVSEQTVRRWLNRDGITKIKRMERNANIVAAYNSGQPLHEICKAFDIAMQTVYNVLNAAGVPRRRSRTPRDDANDAKVVDMYQSGHTLKAIKHATGYSLNTIYDALYERGVPLRRKGLPVVNDECKGTSRSNELTIEEIVPSRQSTARKP